MMKNMNIELVQPITSSITLIRPKKHNLSDFAEDYGLKKHTTGVFNLEFVDGDHMSMISNSRLPEMLMREFKMMKTDKEFF